MFQLAKTLSCLPRPTRNASGSMRTSTGSGVMLCRGAPADSKQQQKSSTAGIALGPLQSEIQAASILLIHSRRLLISCLIQLQTRVDFAHHIGGLMDTQIPYLWKNKIMYFNVWRMPGYSFFINQEGQILDT